MKRVKGVEDLNIRIVRAQGIVGVGVTILIVTAWCPVAGSRRMARVGSPAGQGAVADVPRAVSALHGEGFRALTFVVKYDNVTSAC